MRDGPGPVRRLVGLWYNGGMKTVLYVKGSDRAPSVQKCAGFSRGARAHGWRVQTVTLPAGQDPDLGRLVAFWKADGLVFDSGGFLKSPDLRRVRRIPSVFLTCRAKCGRGRLVTVCEDLRQTAECAACELLALGLRHYAFVHYPQTRYWSEERARHFREILRLNGADCAAFASDDGASPLAWSARLQAWLRDLPRPCGVFAANDEVAHLVRGVCAKEGLSIPDDVAVVGVDDDESLCTGVRPYLSSVLADNEQMGFLAAHLLSERFRGAWPAPGVVPPLMVVRRDSTRQRDDSGSRVAKAVALIRDKACERLKARDVLAVLGGSRRTAEMRFREATGRSVLEEIQRVRVARARELLADRSRPLYVVANLCGYASESAFRKVYRACLGESPRRRETGGTASVPSVADATERVPPAVEATERVPPAVTRQGARAKRQRRNMV